MLKNTIDLNSELVSVIILCYGAATRILPTIDSVLSQTDVKLEIIISNDGGIGFDKKYVEEYILDRKTTSLVNLLVCSFEENVGTVRNINRAIKLSNGSFIKIIGDDLLYDETVIKNQISFLRNNNNYDLVVGLSSQCNNNYAEIKDSRIEKTNSVLKLVYGEDRERYFVYCRKKGYSPFVTQSACFKKTFFEKYGMFDESYVLLEDAPMGAKLLLEHIPVGVYEKPVVRHVCGTGVSTGKKKIDPKKCLYYQDLLLYTETYIKANKKILGRTFVAMSYGTSCFRVKYAIAKKDKKNTFYLFFLIVKYSFPLLMYLIYKIYRRF